MEDGQDGQVGNQGGGDCSRPGGVWRWVRWEGDTSEAHTDSESTEGRAKRTGWEGRGPQEEGQAQGGPEAFHLSSCLTGTKAEKMAQRQAANTRYGSQLLFADSSICLSPSTPPPPFIY